MGRKQRGVHRQDECPGWPDSVISAQDAARALLCPRAAKRLEFPRSCPKKGAPTWAPRWRHLPCPGRDPRPTCPSPVPWCPWMSAAVRSRDTRVWGCQALLLDLNTPWVSCCAVSCPHIFLGRCLLLSLQQCGVGRGMVQTPERDPSSGATGNHMGPRRWSVSVGSSGWRLWLDASQTKSSVYSEVSGRR